MTMEANEILRVMAQYGKDISMYDEAFLAKSLEKRMKAIGAGTDAEYLSYLAKNDGIEIEAFFRSLNINYSGFFRDPLTFALLEQWILPKLLEKKSGRGEIRIWSAGCSAGQEAYSIAILLDKLVVAVGKKLRYRIFATDTSQSALALAREGRYSVDEVQNVRVKQLRDYFTKQGETYSIASRLRDSVTFSTYDLLDKRSSNPAESIYGEFDLVFCSNLLFYYRPDLRQFILNKVQQSLSPMGYLVTGQAEKAFVAQREGLRMVAPPAAIFQKSKGDGQ